MGQSCSPAPCLNNKNQIQPEETAANKVDLSKSQSTGSATPGTPQFNVAHSLSSSSSLTKFKANRQQGVRQLKQNYSIDINTKVVGVGQYGKVFQTYNKHDKSLQVAIKVLEKKQQYNLD